MCSIMGYTGSAIPMAEIKKGFGETISQDPDMIQILTLRQGILGFSPPRYHGLGRDWHVPSV